MIIGKGLIGSLFAHYDDDKVIFFASGVSNSSETDLNQFLREETLIKETITKYPNLLFVYFSTCSIYDSSKNNSPYVLHKHKMEELIRKITEKHLILRISNAVGKGGNPNLLMNYLVRSLKNNEVITIHKKATRNLIDVDDIRALTLKLIQSGIYNKSINIAYPQEFSVLYLVKIIENFFNTSIQHNLLNTGSGYTINIPETEAYFLENNLLNQEKYINSMLEKYYS